MDNIELTSCDKRLSNNKQISAESCSDDDEGKEIAMETVEELLESVITELADDNYIERLVEFLKKYMHVVFVLKCSLPVFGTNLIFNYPVKNTGLFSIRRNFGI